MDDDLVKRLRDAAKISEALAVLLPHSEGNATAKLYNEAADTIEELSKSRWEKFVLRPLTEEEQREHPDWCYILDCHTPDDGQEILVSDGRYVWTDTFYQDEECYLDSGAELESCWWQPMPQPPTEE